MLYTDLVRGLLIPLALAVFALVALARALQMGGGLQLAPVVLTLCLLSLAGLRLRHYFRSRAARGGGVRRAR